MQPVGSHVPGSAYGCKTGRPARVSGTMQEKVTPMIELTELQIQALDNPESTPPRLVNPRTNKTFVLLPVEEYERIKVAYDDSPWTREELQALAWEAGKHAGCEDIDEYDVPSVKP